MKTKKATADRTKPAAPIHENGQLWEELKKLDRDLRDASRLLGRREARYLTDLYYQIQEFRKASANQVRSQDEEPNRVLGWVFESMRRLEANVQKALGEFAASYNVGAWMQSLTGIGPVLSAGFLSHLDIRKAPTAGKFWRFAGLDSSVIWKGKEDCKAWLKQTYPDGNFIVADVARHWGREAGTLMRLASTKPNGDAKPLTLDSLAAALARRPWNADLKVLCFKFEDCAVKFQNNENDHYGKLYVRRKLYEQQRNDSGQLAEQAAAALEHKRYGKETEARGHYEAGHLPPAHIHSRAMRWTGKIFLSHLHHVMHVDFFGIEPPKPFALSKLGPTHTEFVPIPNWPWEGEGKRLTEMGE